jgi:hypothetical protein
MKNRAGFKGMIWVLMLTLVLPLAGCGVMKKRFYRKAPEGVVSTASTVRVVGYEETVTLKTTPEALLALLSNPANLAPGGIEVNNVTASAGDAASLGQAVPFNLKRMGIEIKGRLIFIKLDPDKTWMIWENPYALQIQRWQFQPTKDGLRLTLRVDTELSTDRKWAPLEGTIEKLNEEIFKELDLMLARLQAHFDPSLDPNKLVAVGRRGESYSAFLQVYRSEAKLQASSAEVEKWVADPANAGWYSTYFTVDDRYTKQAFTSAPGTVTYAPIVLRAGLMKVPVDSFLLTAEPGKGSLLKAYFVTQGYVSVLEIRTKSELGVVAVTGEYKTEIPEAISPQGMDLIMLEQGIPQMLQDRILALKTGVEKRGGN